MANLTTTVNADLQRRLAERGFVCTSGDEYHNVDLLPDGLTAYLSVGAEKSGHGDVRIDGSAGVYDTRVDEKVSQAPRESLDAISLRPDRSHWFLTITPWRALSPTETMGPLEWWARDETTAADAVEDVLIFVDQYVLPWLTSFTSPAAILDDVQRYESGTCISTVRAHAARAALDGNANEAEAILDHWLATFPDPDETAADRAKLNGWQRRAPQRKDSREKLSAFRSWVVDLAPAQ